MIYFSLFSTFYINNRLTVVPGTYLFTIEKVEIEANAFAAELLIGDIDPKEYEGFCLSQVASCLEVTEKMVEYKVKYMTD